MLGRRSAARDGSMAFAFCELCSRSVEAGKGHVFTRAHQGSVKRYLGKATVEMGEVVPFLSPVIDLWRGSATAPHSAITTSFWCRFCNEEVVDSGRFAWCVCAPALSPFPLLTPACCVVQPSCCGAPVLLRAPRPRPALHDSQHSR